MTKYYAAKIQTIDAKADKERRFRNILANSGDIMESGEVRDLENLYVMGHDKKLYRIRDLNKDPEKQNEVYALKAVADHGELKDGELIATVEKQFGGCKAWIDEDGLHARVYFGTNALADHCWGISEFASYSTGIDWFPDGYYGAGYEIEEPIGILREISMVLTGNDPRAKTIDTKKAESKGQRAADASGDKLTKGKNMPKKLDQLTPDEREALVREIVDEIDKFTTNAPESETEPTARDTKDDVEANAEGGEEVTVIERKDGIVKKTEDKTTYGPHTLIIRDRVDVKQERGAFSTHDAYLKSDKAVAAWGRALLDSKGDPKAWRDNFRKQAKRDGVDFGENVSLAPEALIKAVAEQMSNQDSIFAHVNKTGLAYEMVAIPTEEDGAVGHKNGQKKTEENIEGVTRVFTPADIYKLMKLDHSMVKLNGGIASSAIVKYVLRELPRKLIATIDQAILVGGIKNEDGTAFTAITSILSDVTASNSIYGSVYTGVAGDNLRATLSKAASRVRSGYERFLITTADFLTDLENATTEGGQLLFPNGIDKENPRLNGIRRILTPLWLTEDMLDGMVAIIVDLPAFHTVGDKDPENFSDYDIDYNKYVWEAVACIGGGLANKNAAVGIKLPVTTTSSDTPTTQSASAAKTTKASAAKVEEVVEEDKAEEKSAK